jgi:formylglycine-generating enzyme required for sulfatase activity/Tfp pilus assembly protein PilF
LPTKQFFVTPEHDTNHGEAATCRECPAEHYEAALNVGFAFRRRVMQWNMVMRNNAAHSIVYVVTSILMLVLVVTPAAAQTTNDVDLCNGKDRTSAEPQIAGCTALIKSNTKNSQVLAIAYNNRGNAYTSKGEYELAIQDYDESIKLNPNYAKPLNNRGVAYQKRGDYDLALKDFDAAIDIDPNYADAFANRAEIYQKKSDYPSALKDFDAAIKLQPTLGVVWNERCWTHAIIGELQAALTDCNEAIRLAPNLVAALDSRGLTYLKLGRWELAIADFNSALRLDSKLPSSLFGRGFAKLKRGDLAGGNADMRAAKAMEQNIEEQFARYGLPTVAAAQPSQMTVPTQPPPVQSSSAPLQPQSSGVTPSAEPALKPKGIFKECDQCPEMVVVPAVSFTMGSPASEPGRDIDEGPQHRVTIAKPFAVARFPLTFDEWDACVADGGCNGYQPGDQGWGRGRQPVINVSWDNATAYVAWLSHKTGKAYRLLTEAEWEYATRAGSTTAYYWGDKIGKGNANCDGCGSKWDNVQTSPVGSFAANAFGLYDMAGNVWQWVDDCYHDNYDRAPTDGSAWIGGDCSRRGVRGGSWISYPQLLRSAGRFWNNHDSRGNLLGFRVGRTLTP